MSTPVTPRPCKSCEAFLSKKTRQDRAKAPSDASEVLLIQRVEHEVASKPYSALPADERAAVSSSDLLSCRAKQSYHTNKKLSNSLYLRFSYNSICSTNRSISWLKVEVEHNPEAAPHGPELSVIYDRISGLCSADLSYLTDTISFYIMQVSGMSNGDI